MVLTLFLYVYVPGRRDLPHRHGDWQQLWYSNFEEFQRLTEPSFDNNTMSNVTVQLGGTAFLHCRVRNLGERTVGDQVRINLTPIGFLLPAPLSLFTIIYSSPFHVVKPSTFSTLIKNKILS